jgi:hypothetical protein
LSQRHDPAAVEQQHNRQLELADCIQQLRREARIRVDQAMASLERNALLLKSSDERGRYRRRQRRGQPAVGTVDQRAVLGDDAVHEMEFAGDATKVVETATCHQHYGNASPPRFGDGVKYRRINPIVARDGAIVIQRQNREFHSVTEQRLETR